MAGVDILSVLDELVKIEDILACMVAQKGLQGLISRTVKIKDPSLWILVQQTTDQIFSFIDRFFYYRLSRIYFELGNYIIIIAPINKFISLIVLVPSLANLGLIDVEIENARRKILKLSMG